MKQAKYYGEMTIGDVGLYCYVLEDHTRVILLDNILNSLVIKGNGGAVKIIKFIENTKNIKQLKNEVAQSIENPIEFKYKEKIYLGYSTTTYTDIIKLLSNISLKSSFTIEQTMTVRHARSFRDALVNVALDALVDEVTGFQEIRSKDALAKILDKYLLKDKPRPWIKTFPLEFYKEIFRLHRWEWKELPNAKKPHTPSVVGKYTREVIYKRIIPEMPRALLKELDALNPRSRSGNRVGHHHSWFNDSEGHPQLIAHIQQIVGIMKTAEDWSQFIRLLKKAFPVGGDQIDMDIDD